MGTVLEITLVTSDPPRAHALIERCFAETERLEGIFTTWRADGELARLNARAGEGPQRASPELIEILLDAKRFARETGGAFDVTVGPLTALWRAAGARSARPTDDEISLARAQVGADRVLLDAERGTIALEAGASVDLGGLAKGWTLDRLGRLLDAEGLDGSLLNFGGSSLRARGAPADAPAWRVAAESGEILVLEDADMSISSGFGQRIEVGVERFSHIVDPRSGLPVPHATRATVRAPDGAVAEAWSTALVVLGAPGLDRIACDSGILAHVTSREGDATNCSTGAK